MTENTHNHQWIDMYYSFDTYEFNVPYLVQYCACGERQSLPIPEEKAQEVKSQYGWA